MSSAIEESKSTPADLPPPRDRKGLRPVSPPLSNVPIRKFNNYMALFATLVFAYYIWRIVQWKTEVGGWWNLALGKRPPIQGGMQAPGSTGGIYPQTGEAKGDSSVEERINELAAALGLASKDLASAIADAVREHVPPASLSSVAAHQTGEAVSHLVSSTASDSSAGQPPTTGSGTIRSVAEAMEAVVGLDEPPNDMV